MATASIELLSVGAALVGLPKPSGALCMDASMPPISDRSPSLWQDHITATGGVLVHLFDCSCTAQRRWAYEILDEVNWTTFRFKAALAPLVFDLCASLIAASSVEKLWFYSDAQLSNPPLVLAKPMSLSALRSHHDKEGIRFNSAIEVIADRI